LATLSKTYAYDFFLSESLRFLLSIFVKSI
jgi:hypothetical protein